MVISPIKRTGGRQALSRWRKQGKGEHRILGRWGGRAGKMIVRRKRKMRKGNSREGEEFGHQWRREEEEDEGQEAEVIDSYLEFRL